MGKKQKASGSATKSTAKAAKKAKAAQKTEKKEKKKSVKTKEEDDDDDLEGILDKEWEEAHTVTEELVEGPPSRRANATLIACPNGSHLWCIGGEFFSEDGKAYFYNDVFRYSPEKDEWRKFVSPTCPGPRSAHAVAATPSGGGKIFIFGGEFSSLYQNNFHHYRDFWCFDITTHSWDRIETKVRPSARSGHRMAVWKHYIVLFGGFFDPGHVTRYLNDTWLFDIQEYKWYSVEFKDTDRKPSPRSGFSFLSTTNGIILHGGYCKEYVKGKRPVGVMLDDTWLLSMTSKTADESKTTASNLPIMRWERRKKNTSAHTPSIRSGCAMTLWPSKNMGVLFGGVTDVDTGEETLESTFHNDLYGYQIDGNGRWISMALRRPKQKGTKKNIVTPVITNLRGKFDEDDDDGAESKSQNSGEDGEVSTHNSSVRKNVEHLQTVKVASKVSPSVEINSDDSSFSIPLPRYNAMLAVIRNALYIYGGIFERGSHEYTLDDFYVLQLDKLDRYICLKESGVIIPAEGSDESSSDEDTGESETDSDEQDNASQSAGSSGDEQDDNEPKLDEHATEEPADVSGRLTRDERGALHLQATEFLGVSRDPTRSAEHVISTPLPGETLATFYTRSREYWTQKAHEISENRGKSLRRDGFALAEERYLAYKPILEEVEKILADAGLDEEEMTRRPGGPGNTAQERNRR